MYPFCLFFKIFNIFTGVEHLGSHRKDSDACVHAVHIIQKDIRLSPGTVHCCDNRNVNNAIILYLLFCIFYIFSVLILGVVLPTLMYWCLYSFVSETPQGRRLGAETCRSF